MKIAFFYFIFLLTGIFLRPIFKSWRIEENHTEQFYSILQVVKCLFLVILNLKNFWKCFNAFSSYSEKIIINAARKSKFVTF